METDVTLCEECNSPMESHSGDDEKGIPETWECIGCGKVEAV